MDLRATLTPAHWRAMQRLHGNAAMNSLAAWIERYAGIKMLYRTRKGDEGMVVRAATVTSGILHLEYQLAINAGKGHRPLADPDGWQLMHTEVVDDPPIWVQPSLAVKLGKQSEAEAPAEDFWGPSSLD